MSRRPGKRGAPERGGRRKRGIAARTIARRPAIFSDPAHRLGVEQVQKDDEGDLVRCLDCGTVYRQVSGERDVRVCPNCGYVGWIAVSIGQATGEQRE